MSDVSLSTLDNHDEAASPPKYAHKRLLLLVAVPLVVALSAATIYLSGGNLVATDNAYLKADKVPISTVVSGMVTEVQVRENQIVRAGQELYRIDDVPFQVALNKAQAKVAQVRTDLQALKANYREKQAEIALAETRYDFAHKEQLRRAKLAAQQLISSAEYDNALQTEKLARQQIDVLTQDLNRIATTLGGSVELPIEAHPSFKTAQAELEQATFNLEHTRVRASMDGIVNMPPRVGQFVNAGGSAMTLVTTSNLWVEANFTEKDLTYVRPGQPVTIKVDTYPDKTWQGVVDSLSPATMAEFSIIPAQNASGNWVKVAQRVPVRIVLASGNQQQDALLRAGLSSEVEIDTGHRHSILGFSL